MNKKTLASPTTQFQARSGAPATWTVYKFEPRFLEIPEEVIENLTDFESSKKYLKKIKEIEWDSEDSSGLNQKFLLKLLGEKPDQVMIEDMSLKMDGSELSVSISKEPAYMLVRK